MRPVAGYRLRGVESDDVPRLQEIRAAAFAPVFDGFANALADRLNHEAVVRVVAALRREQDAHFDAIVAPGSGVSLLVAEGADGVAGFCAWSVDRETGIGEIGLNAVDPVAQDGGLGRWMYAHVLEAMRASGMRVATVSTGADPAHAPARTAYARAGFGPGLESRHLYRAL